MIQVLWCAACDVRFAACGLDTVFCLRFGGSWRVRNCVACLRRQVAVGAFVGCKALSMREPGRVMIDFPR